MAREAKVVANAKTKRSKHARDVVTRITLQQIALTLTKRAENVEKVGHLSSACRSAGPPQPKSKSCGKKGKGGVGARAAKTCWACGESRHFSLQCPKKNVHAVEESGTGSQVGSQETTIMIGATGGYFDLGSVSEGHR